MAAAAHKWVKYICTAFEEAIPEVALSQPAGTQPLEPEGVGYSYHSVEKRLCLIESF